MRTGVTHAADAPVNPAQVRRLLKRIGGALSLVEGARWGNSSSAVGRRRAQTLCASGASALRPSTVVHGSVDAFEGSSRRMSGTMMDTPWRSCLHFFLAAGLHHVAGYRLSCEQGSTRDLDLCVGSRLFGAVDYAIKADSTSRRLGESPRRLVASSIRRQCSPGCDAIEGGGIAAVGFAAYWGAG